MLSQAGNWRMQHGLNSLVVFQNICNLTDRVFVAPSCVPPPSYITLEMSLASPSGRLATPTIQLNDEGPLLDGFPGIRNNPLQTDQPTSMDTPKSLQELLRYKGIEHKDKSLFWPEPLLKSIITLDRIKAQVATDNNISSDMVEQLSQTIHTAYVKIFAILNLIGKERCIYRLLSDGIMDAKLPLQLTNPRECCIASEGSKLSCFDDWSHWERESFVRMQYRVNSKFLDFEEDRKTIKHEIYQMQDVLPILEDQHKEMSGYGAVSKVKMHPDGHGFHGISKSVCILGLAIRQISLTAVTIDHYKRLLRSEAAPCERRGRAAERKRFQERS
jgi:hypothetical protein